MISKQYKIYNLLYNNLFTYGKKIGYAYERQSHVKSCYYDI